VLINFFLTETKLISDIESAIRSIVSTAKARPWILDFLEKIYRKQNGLGTSFALRKNLNCYAHTLEKDRGSDWKGTWNLTRVNKPFQIWLRARDVLSHTSRSTGFLKEKVARTFAKEYTNGNLARIYNMLNGTQMALSKLSKGESVIVDKCYIDKKIIQ